MVIKQKFNPALQICKKSCEDICVVQERVWDTEHLNDVNYIGCMQIREVWKHYYQEYYISNYGYVVKIKPEDNEKAEALIPEKLKNADENSEGMQWVDFSDALKKLFRENAFVPLNRHSSGCQVCLNITGKTPDYDVHKLVARFFLKKPNDKKSYVVHHIDNNSYNNSVTNLVYLEAGTHRGIQHKIYHPMSHG